MYITNSQKITMSSKCSQQTTVEISYHWNMYNILYKNDNLARFNLVKIVKPIEKCQTTDFIFFLASSQCHNTVQNLHGNMLLIFFPIIFLRKHHLLIDKQKDPTSIKSNASLLFFLARACQHKTRKIGIIILSLSQLKLYILQDCKHSKSTYLATFYSPLKILETVHFIFL